VLGSSTWFEPAEHALADSIRFLAYLMTYSTADEVAVVMRYVGLDDLCRAISLAHMAWRVECGVRRRQVLVEEVRKIAASLHEVGREPTLREVASRMAKPGSFRDPSARVALAQIRLELGPVPAWAVVDHSVENAKA
jgi:hypothetical protein